MGPSVAKSAGVRAVPRITEGTSAILLQSGLDEKWWADSVECYCNLRNVQDLLANGQTPYERRFGEPFKGQQYFLEQSLNIILFQHEINQDFIHLARMFCQESFLGML